MQNQPLARKIGLGFAMIGLVFITAVTLTLTQTAQLKQTQNTLLNIRTPASHAALRLLSAIAGVQAQVSNLDAQRTESGFTDYRQSWETLIEPPLNRLTSLAAQSNIPQLTGQIQAIHDQVQQLHQYLNQQHAHPSARIPSQTREYSGRIHALRSTLNAFIQQQETTTQLELIDSHNQIEMLALINWVLLLIGLMLCALFALVLTKFITHPVNSIVRLAQSIAKGELNCSVDIKGAREYEELSQALGSMINRLNELACVIRAMSYGDYSKRLQVINKNDSLGNGVNKMLNDFDIIVEQVNTIASGKFTCHIQPRSVYDCLVQSVQHMTQQLSENQQSLKKQKNELVISNNKLTVASKYKSDFLANMSHEFRTPLNSIILLAKLMRENKTGELSEKHVESATVIERAGNELYDLINDILDLAKVEAGKLRLVVDSVLIAPLLRECREDFSAIAQNKSIDLRIEIDSQLPESIDTDRQRLKQILKNLISNAIKFTNRGTITVTATRTQDEHINVTVADTGCGISASDLNVIFRAFEQGVHPSGDIQHGTGLGLSISLHLARLLGGQLSATSRLGEGSQFSARLPLQTPVSTEPPAHPHVLKEASHDAL